MARHLSSLLGRRSFATDAFLLTAVRFGSVVTAFVASVIGARLIGAAGLGAAAVGVTVATAASLVANGGLGIAAIYFLGRRPERKETIAGNVAGMAFVSVALAALVVAAATPLTVALVLPESGAVLLAAAVLAPAIVAAEIGGAVLLGLHRRGRYMLVDALRHFGALVTIAAVLLLVLRSEAGYVLGTAIATWAAASLSWVVIHRLLGGIHLHLDTHFAREALAMGIRGQVGNLLQFLNLRLDLLIVPALLPLSSAGIYVVAVRASEVVIQVANAVGLLIFPHVAAQLRPGDTLATERATRVTLLLVIGSGAVLVLVADPLLALAFGEQFQAGASTLRISMLGMPALALMRILGGDLKGRGRAGLVSIANLLGLVLTVVLNLLLIPLLGIEGAALASVIVYGAGATTLLLAYRRLTGARLRNLVPTPADVRLLLQLVRRPLGRAVAEPEITDVE